MKLRRKPPTTNDPAAGATLARRLLSWGRRLVHATSIYALTIYGVACVVPTPLDQAQPEPEYRPVIVASQVTPMFGILARTSQDLIQIHVAAEDGNKDDHLLAHLFVQRGQQQLTDTGYGIDLSYPSVPDPTHPFLRTGDFVALNLCMTYPGVSELFLAVADRPFTGHTDTANGGLVDEKHWELQCM